MLIVRSMRQIYNHGKVLNVQTIGKESLCGGVRMKINGQTCWRRTGTISSSQDHTIKDKQFSILYNRLLRTKMT